LKVNEPSDTLVRTSMSEKAVLGVDFLVLIDTLDPFVGVVLHKLLASVHFVHFVLLLRLFFFISIYLQEKIIEKSNNFPTQLFSVCSLVYLFVCLFVLFNTKYQKKNKRKLRWCCNCCC